MFRSEYAISSISCGMMSDEPIGENIQSSNLFSSSRSTDFNMSPILEPNGPDNYFFPMEFNRGNAWQSEEGTFFGEINYWRDDLYAEEKPAGADNTVFPLSVSGRDQAACQGEEIRDSFPNTGNIDFDDLLNVVPSVFSSTDISGVGSCNLQEVNNSSATHAADAATMHQQIACPPEFVEINCLGSDILPEERYCPNGAYPFGTQVNPVPIPVQNPDSTSEDPMVAHLRKPAKKYAKRSKNGASTSGHRRERTLHYCHICSKGFKDKYSVNVHIRIHTGEKPFNCKYCAKTFRQKAHLAKHYQTHLNRTKSF